VDLGIRGRRAAVAAASRGLGLAVATALAHEGVAVAICGRDRSRLDQAARSIGGEVTTIVCDVATMEGAAAFVEQAQAALGLIDILVANGGGPPGGDFDSTPLDAYAPAVERSMLSAVAMCHRVLPPMRDQRWGRILAITSIAVRQPLENLILSNSARTGLTGFLKTLAREVAADGVTVNSLQPGLHATERIRELYGDRLAERAKAVASGTIGRPEDFGRIAAMLCSEHAQFLTGAGIHIDGGEYAGLQ
jgi:3-oxoacyl-[acyl-carrier protein] reductase